MAAGLAYDSIATTTLGSAASSITFNSISSSYTDLRIVWLARNANSDFPGLRFNGDTGTNYSFTSMYGSGTVSASVRYSSQTEIGIAGDIAIATAASTFTLITFDIFSYAGSTNKTVLSVYSNNRNTGGGEVTRSVGLWRSTSAINSITLKSRDGTNFAIGTTASIYGITKA